MRCRYCYAPPQASPAMAEGTALAAMRMGAALNGGQCGVVFFGGEPLLEKGLIRSLVAGGRGMQSRGEAAFHYKITTNGLALDGEFLEFCVKNEIMVSMSFDGLPDAHDAHRVLADGSPTSAALLERLTMLLAFKPYASVIMVVNPDTAARMAEGVEFLLDLGVRYLIVALNYAADWQDEHLDELETQYARLGRLYVRWTRAGRKFYLSPFETKIASHVDGGCFAGHRCDLGRRQISVDPAGYLYPCVQVVKAGAESRWCIGSVAGGLDRQRQRALNVEASARKEACAVCDLEPRCTHTCACLNWQTTGATTQVCPPLCRHERMLTAAADRVGGILYKRRDPLFIQKHYNAAYPVLSLLEENL